MPSWLWSKSAAEEPKREATESSDAHLDQARESLRALVVDARVPDKVRDSLAGDFRQVEAMLNLSLIHI